MKSGGGRYVLVTSDSDYMAGHYHLPDNVLKWFGVNMMNHSDRYEGIPLGLANPHYAHGNTELLEYESGQKRDISNLLYVHFAINTKRDIRYPLWEKFHDEPWVTEKCYANGPDRGDYAEYLRGVHSHRFVLSPQGNGIDCHRHWEAMYLGAIPIIKRHPAMSWFYDYPALFVDEWDDITGDILEDHLEFMRYPSDAPLFTEYWQQRFWETQYGKERNA